MRKILTLAIATLVTTAALGAGEVYRWKDANGVWHFSDQPIPGAELVKGMPRASTGNSTPAAASAPASTAAAPPALPPVSPAVANQVRQEAATAKAEQCKKAEEAYQTMITKQRLYKEDASGNRTYLNEAEIDAARLEARSARDLACGA